MIEGLIQFVTTHSEALIAGSFSVILILSGVLIYFNVFMAKPSVDPEADFKKIEASIEKLLSKAEFMKAAPAAAAGEAGAEGEAAAGEGGEAASGEGVSSTDVLELEAELADKKREIEKLKKDIESGATGSADDNTPELLAKIKNLEDRLAEYEIIEDDIADLSHYKEENERLKKQLAEGGAAPAAAEPAAAEEAPAEVTPEAVPAGEVVEATAEAEPEFPMQAEAEADKAAESKSDDDDIAAALAAMDEDEPAAEAAPAESSDMEEFSKAVEDLEAQKEEAAPAEEVAEAAPAEEEAPAKPEGSDDVFAEMSDSGEEASDDPLAALGDIDTNKMLEELQGLEADASAGADVLEEQTDVDKMASEAENLEKKS